MESAISIKLISHWSITRMMCPVRHAFVLSDTKNMLNFPWGVLYFFKNSLQLLFYTTSAKRKMILVFISHLVWGKIKLFDINRVGQDMWLLWSEIYKALPLENKNYLMCYLLCHETYPVSKKTLSGIKYNRQKLRKTCVLSDLLISMVSCEKHNLHN